MTVKPVLLFAYGNPSRGDDALAPLLLERLKHQGIVQACGHPLKFLSDYQMQIEHVVDLQGCERVLLMDADSSVTSPFCFYPVTEAAETLYTTHGMSPSSLLHTFRKVFNDKAPLTSMLAIQGEGFNMGDDLTHRAQQNFNLCCEFLVSILAANDFHLWDERLR